jgi:RNA polymerase sigma-70 factor (ECF subfamily)
MTLRVMMTGSATERTGGNAGRVAGGGVPGAGMPGDGVPGPQAVGRRGGELDEATLVARARDGDVRAFEELVRRYQAPIFRLALRMLANRGDAEDLVQDAFLTAWRRLPGLHADAAFAAWLYRMAANRCLNVLRARRPSVELDTERTASTAAEVQPERAAEIGGQLDALTRALQRLTPAQRACWLLREAHGRSYAEIAEITGVSETAVRGRLARARAELVEVMASWR